MSGMQRVLVLLGVIGAILASYVGITTRARVALAALLVPLIHPKTWPIEDPIFAPTPVLERLARRVGGPATPRFAQALERDPAPGELLEPSLPLGSDGVRRWVWHSRHGEMLIEVIGKEAFVNGRRVEPHAP